MSEPPDPSYPSAAPVEGAEESTSTPPPPPIVDEDSPQATVSKAQEKKKKKKKKDGLGTTRGIETMFRASYRTHNDLSSLADHKANIMISINGLIISILMASMRAALGPDRWLMIPTVVMLLGCLASLVFAVLAARPRITRNTVTSDDIRSGKANILFFGNFVGMTEEDYIQGIKELMRDTDRAYLSMIRDIYSLGGVLERKFRLLKVSYTAFIFGLGGGVLLLLVAYALAAASQP